MRRMRLMSFSYSSESEERRVIAENREIKVFEFECCSMLIHIPDTSMYLMQANRIRISDEKLNEKRVA